MLHAATHAPQGYISRNIVSRFAYSFVWLLSGILIALKRSTALMKCQVKSAKSRAAALTTSLVYQARCRFRLVRLTNLPHDLRYYEIIEPMFTLKATNYVTHLLLCAVSLYSPTFIAYVGSRH